MKFAQNIFNIFNFNESSILTSYIENFHFNLSSQMYSPCNIESDSALYNIFPLIFTTSALWTLHIVCALIKIKLCRSFEIRRWKICSKIINTVYLYLTFSYYIRVVLETNQYLLITSIYEIYSFNISSPLRIISLAAAFVIMFACVGLIIVI